MSDIFEFNKTEYAESADKIKLSDTQKNILISKMQQAGSKEDKIIPIKQHRLWTKAIAAVLMLAIISGVLFFFGRAEQNSFVMTANASEISEAEVEIESDYVAGMKVNALERKDLQEYSNEEYVTDWIEHISISDLSITGKNIESVSFKANKKFSHFAVFPLDQDDFDGKADVNKKPTKDKDFVETLEKNYEEVLPLTNSNFKEKEEETYSLSVQGKRCDGFTYTNPNTTDGEDKISFGSNVQLCFETDRFHDKVQDEYMNIIQDCEQRLNEMIQDYEVLDDGISRHILTEEETALVKKQWEYRGKLLERLMDGASIDITVNFKDGTQQTKTMVVKYKSLEDSALKMSLVYFVDKNEENSVSQISNDSDDEDVEIYIMSGSCSSNFLQVFSENSVEPYYNKFGKRDMIYDFILSDLKITGENIESIDFKLNNKSTYFHIKTEDIAGKYTNILPLTNSQYTKEEFEKYGDAFYGYVCDGFTYQNTEHRKVVDLSDMIGIWVESDYSDSEIAEWMDIVWECNDKREEYQRIYAPENKIDGMRHTTEEEIANDKREFEYINKYLQKTLEGATLDITIKFADGSEELKTLVLGYDSDGITSFIITEVE